MKIIRRSRWARLWAVIASTSLAVVPLQYAQAADAENTVFINEIESSDANDGNDWIEIINAGTEDVDISGWFVSDDKKLERLDDNSIWRIVEGTVLKAGEVLVLEDSIDFDFGLGKADEANLYDGESNLLDTYSWSGHANGTYARVPDGTGEFVDQEPTKGILNVAENEEETEGETEEDTPTQDWTLKTIGFENGNAVDLSKIGSYITGVSNSEGGVAEIISYDSVHNTAWVVNGATGKLDIVNLSDVTCSGSDIMTADSLNIKEMVETMDSEFAYGDMTSVSINSSKGIVAVALQAEAYDAAGKVAILSTEGTLLALLDAGVQPDMVTFTPDESTILVANEGEPREGYGTGVIDPAGSVTVVKVNYDNLAESKCTNVGFESYDAKRAELVSDGIMMVKDAMPSADFEPEYIACDDNTAYVALQEANAIAVLDLNTLKYKGVYSLGYKDLSMEVNAIDLIEDGQYEAKNYENAVGAYMPDGVSLYTVNGNSYIITANEGDAREWGSGENEYVNETKATLTATDGATAKKVRVIDTGVTDGLPEGKNVLYGGRSFSIYKVTSNGLEQVYDSANDFEEMTAAYIPNYFNCSNDDNDVDSRSPKKGVEPESVTIGQVGDKTYAFVALERIGGIMMYDITTPEQTSYENYINTRDFSENPENANEVSLTGDVAPEGLYFINNADSHANVPVLLAACEVSGTVAAYKIGNGTVSHKLTHMEATEATTEIEGNLEYWYCRDCDKVYLDAEGTQECMWEDVLISKLVADDSVENSDGDKEEDTDTDNKKDMVEETTTEEIQTGDHLFNRSIVCMLVFSIAVIALTLYKKYRLN